MKAANSENSRLANARLPLTVLDGLELRVTLPRSLRVDEILSDVIPPWAFADTLQCLPGEWIPTAGSDMCLLYLHLPI